MGFKSIHANKRGSLSFFHKNHISLRLAYEHVVVNKLCRHWSGWFFFFFFFSNANQLSVCILTYSRSGSYEQIIIKSESPYNKFHSRKCLSRMLWSNTILVMVILTCHWITRFPNPAEGWFQLRNTYSGSISSYSTTPETERSSGWLL